MQVRVYPLFWLHSLLIKNLQRQATAAAEINTRCLPTQGDVIGVVPVVPMEVKLTHLCGILTYCTGANTTIQTQWGSTCQWELRPLVM